MFAFVEALRLVAPDEVSLQGRQVTWLRTFGLAAGLLGGSLVGEAIAERRDRQRFPAPGSFVEVGRRRIHVQARGAGQTVVLLDASLGAWSSHWSMVAAALSEHATVLSYDRAGLGWSDPRAGRSSLAALVADLEVVLEARAPGRPVVLVGHGLDALACQVAAARGAERVAGLVVVDGFPIDFPGSMVLPPLPFATSGQGQLLHATGLSRMTEWFKRGLGDWDAMTALSMQRSVRRATDAERELVVSNREAELVREQLDIPLRVVASSQPLGRRKPCDYSLHWYAHNEALADRSDESMHYVIRDCDHWIPLHRPDAVVEPVRGLLSGLERQ